MLHARVLTGDNFSRVGGLRQQLSKEPTHSVFCRHSGAGRETRRCPYPRTAPILGEVLGLASGRGLRVNS
jgi:hypothetical protein